MIIPQQFLFNSYTHRWAQIANPLICKANFFTSGLAVQLTFKNVSGLVIEANFFSQTFNPLEQEQLLPRF